MKLNKPVVITPGHIIGIITFMKAWKCEHPSILAASSNSDGIFWKKERINQIVKGWFIATKTAITANGFPNKVGAKSPKRGLKISDEFIKKGKYPATKIEWGNALKTNAITKIQNAKEEETEETTENDEEFDAKAAWDNLETDDETIEE